MGPANKIIFGILAFKFASVIRILRLISILKNCTCAKSLVDDLVNMCDEIVNPSGTALIDFIDKKVA